jgi:hypothetical protein
MNGNNLRTALAGTLVALATASAPATRGAADFAWLAGSWCGQLDEAFSEEIWTAPRGGLLLGLHRDTSPGRATSFEFFRIELVDGRATYLAQPGGRAPTVFELSASDARSATFVNESHDFPKRVSYERLPDGRLRARVDDGREGGRREEWTWSRCELQRGF